VEKVAGGVTTSYAYDGPNILREARGATLSMYDGSRIDELSVRTPSFSQDVRAVVRVAGCHAPATFSTLLPFGS